MTFAAVGSLIQATASTFTLTPGTVGDLICLHVCGTSSNVHATALSSSNVTWSAPIVEKDDATILGGCSATLFLGTVTSTSSATVTVTWGGTAPTTIRIAGQEYSSTVGSWAADTTGSIDTAGGTNTFASLTPAAAHELYSGYAIDTGTATVGSTSGYTYDVDAHGNGMAFNANCTSSAQAPVWGDSGSVLGVMALIAETPTVVSNNAYQAQPPGRKSPASIGLPDYFPYGNQPINVVGGIALAPLAFSGNVQQPVSDGNIPAIPPGLQSPAAFGDTAGDALPSQTQPINVSGSISLAPLAFGGQISPAAQLQQGTGMTPPGRISPASLTVGDWNPSASAPVTVTGNINLAPLALNVTGQVLYPQPGASEVIPPGMQSPAALGMPVENSVPAPAPPVNVSGSIALAPLGFSGNVPSSSQQQGNAYISEPPGKVSPAAIGLPDWVASAIQPIIVNGSISLAPLAFSGSSNPVPPSPPSSSASIVPPGLRSPASISERMELFSGRTSRPGPINFSGSIALAPLAFNGSVQTPFIQLVQEADNSVQSNSVTTTFGNNIKAGNSVVVVMMGGNAFNLSPTGGPDSWTVLNIPNSANVSIAYVSSSVGGYKTITANQGASYTWTAMYAYEVTPAITFDVASGGNQDPGSGNPDSGSTVDTAQPQEFWVGGCWEWSSTSGSSISGAATPWTNETAYNAVFDSLFSRYSNAVSGYQITSATGTADYAATNFVGTGVAWYAAVATFRMVANPVQMFDIGKSKEQIQVGVVQNESPSESDTGTSSELISIGQFQQFPLSVLPLKTELLLNGSWVDISPRVYARANVTIQRGRTNETSAATPSSLTMTLDNRDGAFSATNPLSPFYPFITRNTQMRVSVSALSSAGTFYPTGGVVGYRFWGEVSEWPPAWDPTGKDVYISITASGVLRRLQNAAKIGSALSRYYSRLTDNRKPVGQWNCDDASGSQFFASAIPGVPNGTWSGTPGLASTTIAGGSDSVAVFSGSVWTFQTGIAGNPASSGTQNYTVPGVYFWTAPNGVTQVTGMFVLGAGGGGAGATTGATTATNGGLGGQSSFIADSVAVRGHGGQGGQTNGQGGPGGTGSSDTIHYDGGAGATAQVSDDQGGGGGSSAGTNSPGTAASGVSGAVAPTGGGNGGDGAAEPGLTGADGQSPAAPPGGGGGGASAFIPGVGFSVGGGGGGGEVGQETTVSVTPLKTYQITVGAGGVNGSGDFVGGFGAAGQVTFSWSTGVSTPVTGNYLRFLLEIPASGGIDGAQLIQMNTLGTISIVSLVYHTGGKLELIGYNSAGTVMFDSGAQLFGTDGVPLLMSIEITPFGSGIDWLVTAMEPGQTTPVASASGSFVGATLGAFSSVQANVEGLDTGQTAMGVITLQYAADSLSTVSVIAGGNVGELAANRFVRLCNEQGIASQIVGYPTDTPAMGPQVNDTLISLLQGIETLDQGQMFEPRTYFGLSYRTRKSLQNQYPKMLIDYSAGQLSPPFAPVQDDQLIRNDVQITRTNGSTASAILSSGPTPWTITTQGAPLNNTYFIAATNAAAVVSLGDTFTDNSNPGQVFSVTAISAPFLGFVNVSFTPTANNPMNSPDIVTQNNVTSLSTQAPPLGVGDYPYQQTVAAENDMQLGPLAQWILEIGTITDFRYPQITLDFSRNANAVHFSDAPNLDVGDYFQIINPPSFLAPANKIIRQLSWGFTETLNNFVWTMQINAVPENPYDGPIMLTW